MEYELESVSFLASAGAAPRRRFDSDSDSKYVMFVHRATVTLSAAAAGELSEFHNRHWQPVAR